MCGLFAADRCCAMRCGAPLEAWRTMNMSAFMATRLSIVSSSVSPLVVEDTPMLRLITSADRRLAAISNVVRVRVLFSKKRLNTVLPRSSGTFFTSRSAIETNGTAVSRMRPMTSAGSPSSVSRCCSSPSALSCGLRTRRTLRRLERERELAMAVALQYDGSVARDRQPRADVGGLDRQLAAAPVDEHGELDRLRSPVVEQLVDRGANGPAGVQHVIDQHDAARADFEGQRGRRRVRAQASRGVVVAVERDVDEADGVVAGKDLRQALGEPRASGVDTHQSGIESDGPAHLVREQAENDLGVRKRLVRQGRPARGSGQPSNRARPCAYAAKRLRPAGPRVPPGW